uniref:Immunoglobulin domain-containing protein n=1 Tax=Salarias fasciatus TaxID=181472 RepID=A0A672HIW3_SALFA
LIFRNVKSPNTKRPLNYSLVLLTALISAKTTEVSVVEGQRLDFRCDYSQNYTNHSKYFCLYDDDEPSGYLIRSEGHDRWETSGRFALYDNTSGPFFTVHLDEPRLDDSGTYWCGVDRLLQLLQCCHNYNTIVVTAVEGQEVEIKCVHSNAASNVKYFCSRPCGDEDVLVTSKRPHKDGKFRIRDKGNTFYVTVSKLRLEDSGTYWCGIERVGVDTYTQVDIRKPPLSHFPFTKTQQISQLSQNREELWGCFVTLVSTGNKSDSHIHNVKSIPNVCVCQLMHVFTLRTEKGQPMVQATPSTQDQDRHPDGAAPSTGQKHGAFSSANSTTDLYSDVSPEPQTQQEALFYSTVSFNKHADCSAATPPDPMTTYTTIELRSTDESAVYSNV